MRSDVMEPEHVKIKECESQLTVAAAVTEEVLEKRLSEAVELFKKKEFDAAEAIFSDLMVHAVLFYKAETHAKMAKFFYFYGDMLLSKLENNPDVFGDQA